MARSVFASLLTITCLAVYVFQFFLNYKDPKKPSLIGSLQLTSYVSVFGMTSWMLYTFYSFILLAEIMFLAYVSFQLIIERDNERNRVLLIIILVIEGVSCLLLKVPGGMKFSSLIASMLMLTNCIAAILGYKHTLEEDYYHSSREARHMDYILKSVPFSLLFSIMSILNLFIIKDNLIIIFKTDTFQFVLCEVMIMTLLSFSVYYSFGAKKADPIPLLTVFFTLLGSGLRIVHLKRLTDDKAKDELPDWAGDFISSGIAATLFTTAGICFLLTLVACFKFVRSWNLEAINLMNLQRLNDTDEPTYGSLGGNLEGPAHTPQWQVMLHKFDNNYSTPIKQKEQRDVDLQPYAI